MSRSTSVCLLKKGQCIVFEGDSLTSRKSPPAFDTWPYLRLNNWHITYPDRLSEWLFCNLPELHLRFSNSAVGGSTIRNVLSRYPTAIQPARPDWLIMTLGTNDIAQHVPVDEFSSKFEDLCRQLKANSSGRVVWVCARPAGAGQAPDPNRIPRSVYYDAIRSVLARHDGLAIDAAAVIEQKEAALKQAWSGHTVCTGPDGHLNAVAAEIISTLILQALGVVTVHL